MNPCTAKVFVTPAGKIGVTVTTHKSATFWFEGFSAAGLRNRLRPWTTETAAAFKEMVESDHGFDSFSPTHVGYVVMGILIGRGPVQWLT